MKEFEKLCKDFKENKRLIEELEAMNDTIKGDIIAFMGERDTWVEGSTKAIYKSVTSSRLDSKSLKEFYPDIYQAYIKESSYKRFTVL